MGNQCEAASRKHARRSLVALCDIPMGVEIKKEYLTWKRPGHGISPKHIDSVVKKRTKCRIQSDEVLQWEMLL